MNYLKIQQAFMAELAAEPTRGPYCVALNDREVMLINCAGTVAYIIPKRLCWLNYLSFFKGLTYDPFKSLQRENCTQLVDTGETVSNNSKPLLVRKRFKRGEEQVLIDPKLLKHFDANAKLYQEKTDGAVIVTETVCGSNIEHIVAYVMPCHNKK